MPPLATTDTDTHKAHREVQIYEMLYYFLIGAVSAVMLAATIAMILRAKSD